MENEKKKLNFKILVPIIIIAVVAIVGIIIFSGTGKKYDKSFEEVAHICNNLGGTGMIITSPKIENVWYFSEDTGTDIVVQVTGDNTTSTYYQYFMLAEGAKDYISVCFAKDELIPANVKLFGSTEDTQQQLNASALMLQSIKDENKMKENDIKELNKLIKSGKIENYKNYEIKR